MIGSWLLGGYLGIWTFFIQPIIYACQSFDAGILTGTIVGVTILKCIFAGTVSGVVVYVGTVIGSLIQGTKIKKRRNK